jgi:PPOX class probable F420-dependent enzyme
MTPMSPEERRAFLRQPVPAMLATVRADGRPHAAPVWIDLDDDDTVVFMTGAGSVKGRALQANPRVAICVDDDKPPFAFVLVEGLAEVSTDLDDMLVWSIRIAGCYMGPEQAEEFGRRNAVEGELLVRVKPVHMVAYKAVAS